MDPYLIRTSMLLPDDAMVRLSKAHVLVVGIGGVGGICAEALVRAGIGEISVVDNDTISESNINRQVFALRSTVGMKKVDAARSRLLDINPALSFHAFPLFFSEETSGDIFSAKYDYVVDAIDTVSAKLHLVETAINKDVPIISALGTGNKLHPAKFKIGDISETTCCPLARVMRRELKHRGILHHRVLWSDEEPLVPAPLEKPEKGRRAVPGSVSWVPPCAGLMIAGDVVLSLLKIK